MSMHQNEAVVCAMAMREMSMTSRTRSDDLVHFNFPVGLPKKILLRWGKTPVCLLGVANGIFSARSAVKIGTQAESHATAQGE